MLESKSLLQPRIKVFAGFRAHGAPGSAELEDRAMAAGDFGHAVLHQSIGRGVVVAGGFPSLRLFHGLWVFDGSVDFAVIQGD